MNMGQYALEIERITKGEKCKVSGLFKADGEMITPSEIMTKIRKVAHV